MFLMVCLPLHLSDQQRVCRTCVKFLCDTLTITTTDEFNPNPAMRIKGGEDYANYCSPFLQMIMKN